ncbi:hypothetical protein ACTD5D_31810 [Nocardia takedensis]|uniref:hypothetical protein n=1 Tax=Nocardia takedensis TaxID=259390 RepID=UPI003F75B5F9
MAIDIEQQHAETLAALPAWSDDPLERLVHTLAAATDRAPDEWALHATGCSHPGPGQPARTGVTWGDLQALADELQAARAMTRMDV